MSSQEAFLTGWIDTICAGLITIRNSPASGKITKSPVLGCTVAWSGCGISWQSPLASVISIGNYLPCPSNRSSDAFMRAPCAARPAIQDDILRNARGPGPR